MALPSLFYDNVPTDKWEEMLTYFMSWTLRCSQDGCQADNPKVNEYSRLILSKCLFGHENGLGGKGVKSVLTGKEINAIDLAAKVEIDDGGGNIFNHLMIFENKASSPIGTRNGKSQLAHIQDAVNDDPVFSKYISLRYIFLRGEDLTTDDISQCKEYGYTAISLGDLYNVIKAKPKTGNELFDEFWFNWWRDTGTAVDPRGKQCADVFDC